MANKPLSSERRSKGSADWIRLDAPRQPKRKPVRLARSWALPGERMMSRLFNRLEVIAPSEEDTRGPMEWQRPRGHTLWEESLPAIALTAHGLFFAFSFLMISGGLPHPGAPGWYAILSILSLGGLCLDVAWLRRILAAPDFHAPRRRFGVLRALFIAYILGHGALCGVIALVAGLPVFFGLLTGQF